MNAFCEPATTTSRPQLRGQHAADRIDHQQRAMLPHQAGDRPHVVQDAGRGLIMGKKDGSELPLSISTQEIRHLVRVRCPAPIDIVALDLGAVRGGDLREAVPESADDDGEHAVARREGIHDGRFQAAGAGGGEDQAVGPGAEHLLQARDQLPLERHVLRPAMVHHLRGEGAENDVRAGSGAGDHQQLLAQCGCSFRWRADTVVLSYSAGREDSTRRHGDTASSRTNLAPGSVSLCSVAPYS
jgi:hypothetical protein